MKKYGKLLIGIAGPTASGKTMVVDVLEKHCGACRLRYSDILIEIANKHGLPTDKATLQNLYVSERKDRGENFLAKLLEERALNIDADIIVVEGNRRLADIVMLKRLTTTLKRTLQFLFIDASPDVRYKRFNKRQMSLHNEQISREVFKKLEQNPAEDELEMIKEIFRKEGTVIETDTLDQEEMLEVALKTLRLN